MNRSLAWFVIPVLALAASSCTDAASNVSPADAPLTVRVAPVTREAITLPVVATGTLEPKDAADLSFKVGGVVARVLVEEGDRVQKGQVLAALDLGEIDPAVARARAAAEKAERDHARLTRLHAEDVVSLAQMQDAATALEAARAEYDAARFNRSHAVISAPADGTVLRRYAEPGEIGSAGSAVLGFGGRTRGQVIRVGLADRDFVRVHDGDAATVTFDAYPGRSFAGVVTERGGSADAATGTYRVEISLPGAASLASGLVGRVEIRPRASQSVSLIPVESLLEANGEQASVYTVSADGQRAERRAVRLAFLSGSRAAIASGLDGVAMVVTEGAGRLDAGDRVEVLR